MAKTYAEAFAKPREFLRLVSEKPVLVRSGNEEYEGSFGSVIIGNMRLDYLRGLQQIAMPIILGDDFLERNPDVFKPHGELTPFSIDPSGVASVTLNGRELEFDFTELGTYSMNALSLWLAAGGSILNKTKSLITFLAHVYNFRDEYPTALLLNVAVGFTALSLLSTNYLKELITKFKTEVFKSFTRDLICIREEYRLCPPNLQTNQ